MLEGQLNCTPFLRLFEDGWHHHIIEWLRRDDYANGMPADANSKYEDDMHSGIKEWQEELSKAQQVVSLPNAFHDAVLTFRRARYSWYTLIRSSQHPRKAS